MENLDTDMLENNLEMDLENKAARETRTIRCLCITVGKRHANLLDSYIRIGHCFVYSRADNKNRRFPDKWWSSKYWGCRFRFCYATFCGLGWPYFLTHD
jgi:hypothetical protein